MIFIDPNGNYPRHIGDLLLEHKAWKTKDSLPDGWTLVEKTDQPIAGTGYMIKESYPALVDGKYQQTWEIVPIPEGYFNILQEEQERSSSRPPSL